MEEEDELDPLFLEKKTNVPSIEQEDELDPQRREGKPRNDGRSRRELVNPTPALTALWISRKTSSRTRRSRFSLSTLTASAMTMSRSSRRRFSQTRRCDARDARDAPALVALQTRPRWCLAARESPPRQLDTEELASALFESSTLQSLILKYLDIGDDGAGAGERPPRELDAHVAPPRGHYIVGASELAKALLVNSTLADLPCPKS